MQSPGVPTQTDDPTPQTPDTEESGVFARVVHFIITLAVFVRLRPTLARDAQSDDVSPSVPFDNAHDWDAEEPQAPPLVQETILITRPRRRTRRDREADRHAARVATAAVFAIIVVSVLVGLMVIGQEAVAMAQTELGTLFDASTPTLP